MSFITVLIIIVGVLLGLVVLIQNPKGGGLVIALFVLSVFSSSLTSTVTTVSEDGTSEFQELVEGESGQQAPVTPAVPE